MRPLNLTTLGVAFVFLARLVVLLAYGASAPIQDEGHAILSSAIGPYSNHTLTLGNLLSPLNDHLLLWTKLVAIGDYKLLGYWSPSAGAFLSLLLMCGVAYLVLREVYKVGGSFCLLIGVLFFAAPIPFTNIILGFHTQYAFQMIFSVGVIYLLTRERLSLASASLAGLLCIASTLETGGAILGPAAALVALLVSKQEKTRIVLAGVMCITCFVLRVGASPMDVHHILQGIVALLRWPCGLFVLLGVPALFLKPRSPFLYGCMAFGILSAVAIALVRPEVSTVLGDKYADAMLLVPLCALTLMSEEARMASFALAMASVVGIGLQTNRVLTRESRDWQAGDSVRLRVAQSWLAPYPRIALTKPSALPSILVRRLQRSRV